MQSIKRDEYRGNIFATLGIVSPLVAIPSKSNAPSGCGVERRLWNRRFFPAIYNAPCDPGGMIRDDHSQGYFGRGSTAGVLNTTKCDSEKFTKKLTPVASTFPNKTGMKCDAIRTVAVLAAKPASCADT